MPKLSDNLSDEVGSSLFRPFTPESLSIIEERITTEDVKQNEDEKKSAKKEPWFEDDDLQSDHTFEQGLPMSVTLRNAFPSKLAGIPLEDIDPFYGKQNTFVVVNKRKHLFRFSATNALWMLSPFNPIRRTAINILVHPLFSWFIITTILVNCFFMTMPITPTIEATEIIFVTIYTIEAVIKIMARGFVLDPFTYLRDPWNWLDLVIIFLAYISMGIDLGSPVILRAFRVLRALKTVGIHPGLKIICSAVFESIKNLWNVMTLIIFSLFIFAVFGLQIYMGVLTQKCVKLFPTDGSWGNNTNENWFKFTINELNWYWENEDYFLCGNSSGSGQCPDGYVCLQGVGYNPNYGYTNFDTFGWSFLSAFRLMTQDYWENLYQLVLLSAGPWHMLFFLVIIFLSFYLINLILAIVAVSYGKLQKKDEEEKAIEEKANKGNFPNESTSEERQTVELTDVVLHNDINDQNCGELNSGANDNNQQEPPRKERPLRSKITDILCVWDCCSCWIKLQKCISFLVLNQFFEFFIMLCIILNTIFMALDHHDMSRDLENILKTGNYIFITIYLIEAIMKLIAMSPKYYFKKGWNVFDFIIVLIAWLELGLEGVQGLSVLRSLRLLRVLRLAKSWPTFNLLISIMGKTISVIGNLSIILCIVIFIFAIIGMQLFGKNYIDNVDRFPNEDLPRWSFVDFMHSFMIVFRALCGEWIESMWDCMLVGDVTCIPFFVGTVLICNFVVINLFIALILSNFGLNRTSTSTLDNDIAEENPENILNNDDNTELNHAGDKASSFWSSWNNLRFKAFQSIENKYFDIIILTIIFLSSLALTLEDIYMFQRPLLQIIIFYLDMIVTVIFIFEMLLKWLGLGLRKYFTNAWCCLDFIINVIALINFITPFCGVKGIQVYRVTRILKALYPLRAISRIRRMRVVVNTLIKAIPSIFSVALVCLVIWLIFAIIGVQLFAGKYFKCVDENRTILNFEVIPDYNTCINENYTWENSRINFDHVGNAYLALFQVATFKGWIQIMNDAIDSREVLKQPIRETNIYMYLYFVYFIIFGKFLLLNCFVGVLIDFFNKQRKKLGLSSLEMFMTENQKTYYNAMKKMRFKKPAKLIPKPKWRPQEIFFNIVTNKKFDMIILLLISLNTLTMAFDHYQQSESFTKILDYLNLFFILIFTIECAIKIFGLRHHYFKDPWNIFDFVVVVLSILSVLVTDIIEKYFVSPTLLRIIRICKVDRLRFITGTKTIRSHLSIYKMSLPALFNICWVIFLVMFVFAIFGMSLFMHAHGLDDNFNFNTFGQSMILLFQLLTFAGWDGVLDDISYEEEYRTIAITFLISYLVICYLIVINMCVVIIMENYSHAMENVKKRFTDDVYDSYLQVWQQFDPNATEYIRYDQLTDFLDMLEPPLQICKPNKHKISSMNIPLHKSDLVFYVDLFDALTKDYFARKDIAKTVEVVDEMHPKQNVSDQDEIS